MAYKYEVNGVIVEFDREPTQADIDEAAKQLGAKKPASDEPLHRRFAPALETFLSEAVNSLAMGLPKALDVATRPERAQVYQSAQQENPVAATSGDIAGMLAPMAAGAKLGARVGGSIFEGLQNLLSRPAIKAAAKEADVATAKNVASKASELGQQAVRQLSEGEQLVARYAELIKKFQNGTITSAETQELLRIGPAVREIQAGGNRATVTVNPQNLAVAPKPVQGPLSRGAKLATQGAFAIPGAQLGAAYTGLGPDITNQARGTGSGLPEATSRSILAGRAMGSIPTSILPVTQSIVGPATGAVPAGLLGISELLTP